MKVTGKNPNTAIREASHTCYICQQLPKNQERNKIRRYEKHHIPVTSARNCKRTRKEPKYSDTRNIVYPLFQPAIAKVTGKNPNTAIRKHHIPALLPALRRYQIRTQIQRYEKHHIPVTSTWNCKRTRKEPRFIDMKNVTYLLL